MNAEHYDPQDQQISLGHFSLDITGLINDAGKKHCKFLSVSPDGAYIAISFLEEKFDEHDKPRKPMNPDCRIFEVKNKKFDYNCTRIKFQGRAVFLNRKDK